MGFHTDVHQNIIGASTKSILIQPQLEKESIQRAGEYANIASDK